LCRGKNLSRRREEYEENWLIIFFKGRKKKKKTHFQARRIIPFSDQA